MNNSQFLKTLDKDEINNLKFMKKAGVYKEALQYMKCSQTKCKMYYDELKKIKEECMKDKKNYYKCYINKAVKSKNSPFNKQVLCLNKNCQTLKNNLNKKLDKQYLKATTKPTKKITKTKKNNKPIKSTKITKSTKT
jgi:hypothetical protein